MSSLGFESNLSGNRMVKCFKEAWEAMGWEKLSLDGDRGWKESSSPVSCFCRDMRTPKDSHIPSEFLSLKAYVLAVAC